MAHGTRIKRASSGTGSGWRARLRALRRAARDAGWAAALLAFGLSRLVYGLAAGYLAPRLPPSPPWVGQVAAPGPRWLALPWRWDAVHYYTIAVGGYGPSPAAVPKISPFDRLPAFFPLFPLLLRAGATALGGLRPPPAVPLAAAGAAPLLAGLFVANAAALIGLRHLFALARPAGAGAARRAVLYAAVFPFAFCYAVPYTEGLFLATSTGAFLAARRGRWVRAGLWAAAAGATRPVGLLLLPPLALELGLAWSRGELAGAARGRALLGMLLAPSGLGLYMLHLWRRVGDPLAWLHTSAIYFRRDRVAPPVTLWRGLDTVLHPERSANTADYLVTSLSLALVLALVIVLALSLRRWRPAYGLYGLLLFAVLLAAPLPDARAMFGLPRYGMIFFPTYLTLARWGARPAIHRAVVAVSVVLFALVAALYTRWYFVG